MVSMVSKVEELLLDYPKSWVLEDGTKVTVRPLEKRDRENLALFFTHIPERELRFLKDDVTNRRVIDQWIDNLDYERVLPLVADLDGRIIADASLHRRKEGWRRHLGGVRVVVDPEFRHKGLAAGLLVELMDIAQAEGLERLYTELPADNRPAIDLFEGRGFTEVARFKRTLLDRGGKYHDLVVLHVELSKKG